MEDTEQGFRFEGQGTLVKIDIFTTKAGKDIQTLILRVGGEYPQLVPVKVLGRLAEEVGDWKPGNVLHVKGRLGGRDWNGKVYGDNVASSVRVLSAGSAKAESQQANLIDNSDDNIPF
jgi:single-stranded DNA-binding protein